MFKKDQLIELLEKIGKEVKTEITIYLIGGCNMSLKGKKDATKDIDIVLTSEAHFRKIKATMQSLGFKQEDEDFAEPVYKAAVIVFKDDSGSRVDLFVKKVASALVLSDKMIERSELYRKMGNLKVMLVSDEDIFLFKSIAGREGDVNDCYILISEKLDWNVIIEECEAQHREDVKWIFWLYEQLCRIELNKEFIVREKDRVFRICLVHWDKREEFMYGFSSKDIRKFIPRRYQQDVLDNLKKAK